MVTIQMSEAAHDALKKAIVAGALYDRNRNLFSLFNAATSNKHGREEDNPHTIAAEAQCLNAAAVAVMRGDRNSAVENTPLSPAYVSTVLRLAHALMLHSSDINPRHTAVVAVERLYKQMTGETL